MNRKTMTKRAKCLCLHQGDIRFVEIKPYMPHNLTPFGGRGALRWLSN